MGGPNSATAAAAAALAVLDRWAPPSAPLAQRFTALAAVALAGAFALACLSCAYETVAFRGYRLLERWGLIDRLVPSKEPTVRRPRPGVPAGGMWVEAPPPRAAARPRTQPSPWPRYGSRELP
jgi:hypothetical protein